MFTRGRHESARGGAQRAVSLLLVAVMVFSMFGGLGGVRAADESAWEVEYTLKVTSGGITTTIEPGDTADINSGDRVEFGFKISGPASGSTNPYAEEFTISLPESIWALIRDDEGMALPTITVDGEPTNLFQSPESGELSEDGTTRTFTLRFAVALDSGIAIDTASAAFSFTAQEAIFLKFNPFTDSDSLEVTIEPGLETPDPFTKLKKYLTGIASPNSEGGGYTYTQSATAAGKPGDYALFQIAVSRYDPDGGTHTISTHELSDQFNRFIYEFIPHQESETLGLTNEEYEVFNHPTETFWEAAPPDSILPPPPEIFLTRCPIW